MKKFMAIFIRWSLRLGSVLVLVIFGYLLRGWLEPVIPQREPRGWRGLSWVTPESGKCREDLVPYPQLLQALPAELPGWTTQEPPFGSCFQHQDYAYTMARQTWSRGDAVLEIQIVDCRLVPFQLENLAQAVAFQEQDTYHFRHGLSGEDYQGFEAYYFQEQRGEIQLAVARRFCLTLEGYHIPDEKALRSALARVSLERLRRLARR